MPPRVARPRPQARDVQWNAIFLGVAAIFCGFYVSAMRRTRFFARSHACFPPEHFSNCNLIFRAYYYYYYSGRIVLASETKRSLRSSLASAFRSELAFQIPRTDKRMRRVSLPYVIAEDSGASDKALFIHFRSARGSCGQKLYGIFCSTLIKRAQSELKIQSVKNFSTYENLQ